MELKLNLITIGCGGISVFLYKFFKARYSFFHFVKNNESKKYILPLVLCKATFEKYRFVKIRKWRAQIGHTNGNAWLKPYKCNPMYATGCFQDESEKLYIYKFDFTLLYMIRIARLFNSSYSNIDFSPLNESIESKDELSCITFYKNKNDILKAYNEP